MQDGRVPTTRSEGAGLAPAGSGVQWRRARLSRGRSVGWRNGRHAHRESSTQAPNQPVSVTPPAGRGDSISAGLCGHP